MDYNSFNIDYWIIEQYSSVLSSGPDIILLSLPLTRYAHVASKIENLMLPYRNSKDVQSTKKSYKRTMT